MSKAFGLNPAHPHALNTRSPQGGAVDRRQFSLEEAALTTDRTFWHESRASKREVCGSIQTKFPGEVREGYWGRRGDSTKEQLGRGPG